MWDLLFQTLLSPTQFLGRLFTPYKSTKPEAAARVKKRLPISSIIITKISILPSCDAHPKVICKSQLFLCPGLQAAVSSCLPPLHHHRERWGELQGAGKLLCPLLSLSVFPDPSTAHNWHFLPASQGACKANSHLVLLVRLPNPAHIRFSQLPHSILLRSSSPRMHLGACPIEPGRSTITSCAFRTCTPPSRPC